MRFVLLLAAAILAAPAQAQDNRDSQDGEILVVGSREREQAIRDFVGALTGPDGGTDPIGRLDGAPICPAAVGLRPERNEAIATRMRSVVSAADMDVAPSPCRPNLLVIFAPDKDEMVGALRQRHPAFFQDGSSQHITLPDEPGPVIAWHVERRVDRRGEAVPYNAETGYYVVTSPLISRLHLAQRPAFVAAIIVIEVDALVGLSTTQIADYAVMRAFTAVDPREVARLGAQTILSALEAPDGSAVPITLTPLDFSFLRALPQTGLFRPGQRQRSDIRRHMTRELERQSEPE